MTSETALIDTNILIYAVNQNSPYHKAAVALRDKGLKGELSLCISPQILNEFYANVSNPKQIDSPLTQTEARLEMEKYFHSRRIVKIYPQLDATHTVLEYLKQYSIVRQEIYDLYLLATMLSNGVKRIYTYNADDFIKYSGIEVLTPEKVDQ